jgi:hypothetical protein
MRGTPHLPVEPSFSDLVGKKSLIMGSVRTGKTRLTVELLEEAVGLGHAEDITVIDMAPETELIGGKSIGGRLEEFTEACRKVRYLAPDKVETPRLRAASPDHLLSMVRLNAERIGPLLASYLNTPSPILFVNDLSIYLQSGSADQVFAAAQLAETFIANGYYGEFFSSDHGTGVSEKERELMGLVASRMDVVIRL